MIAKVYVAVLMCVDSEKKARSWLTDRFEVFYEGSIQLFPSGPRNAVCLPLMSIVSEPQLAGGLTPMVSLSTVVDGLPATRFITPDLNVAAYVCD